MREGGKAEERWKGRGRKREKQGALPREERGKREGGEGEKSNCHLWHHHMLPVATCYVLRAIKYISAVNSGLTRLCL